MVERFTTPSSSTRPHCLKSTRPRAGV
jgi:hypothetical protein